MSAASLCVCVRRCVCVVGCLRACVWPCVHMCLRVFLCARMILLMFVYGHECMGLECFWASTGMHVVRVCACVRVYVRTQV